MKFIEKEAVTPVDKAGAIYNTTNIENKDENTYSANVIDGLVKDNYSTGEQIIGYWIDGRPIYRKVFLLAKDLIIVANDWAYGNTIPLSNVRQIINAMGSQVNGANSPLRVTVTGDIMNATNSQITINAIIVEYTKTTDKPDMMINFTVNCSATHIGNKTYQAEYGMTWREWINSEYNVDNYYVEDTTVRLNTTYYLTSAKITDTIQANTTYATSKGK